MNNISNHITYQQATRSNIAIKFNIDNTPNAKQLENMRALAENIYEPIIEVFGEVVFIHSFFRSELLNTKIGGVMSSQHKALKGAAIDIDAQPYGKVTNKTIFNFIKEWLDFDQLIWEKGTKDEPEWIHVSYNKKNNRGQVIYSI